MMEPKESTVKKRQEKLISVPAQPLVSKFFWEGVLLGLMVEKDGLVSLWDNKCGLVPSPGHRS